MRGIIPCHFFHPPPDRFRQVEVLQQVTTTLRGLVISSTPSSLRAPSEKMLSPEARERRRRMASLFRRATKKSLNQNHAYKTQDITSPAPVTSDSVTPELPQHAASPENEKIKCLSPVTDERENNPKFTIQPHPDQNQQLRPGPLGEDVSPVKASASVKRKSLANGAPPDSEKASYEVTYSEWVCLKGMCYKCSFQKSLYAFLCSCLKFYTEIMFFYFCPITENCNVRVFTFWSKGLLTPPHFYNSGPFVC